LLFDLLTVEEARDRHNVFDTSLLAQRLLMATAWVSRDAETRDLLVGYFGASTGAAAALVAAAAGEGSAAAIVSRGGRPDLAGSALASVTAPTLLIVGDADRGAGAQSRGPCRVALRKTARHRARCHPPVRGAWNARGGRRACARMVLEAFH
jgi:dienelactone hydrolase